MTTPESWIVEFRKKFHDYEMDNPRDVMIEDPSGDIEDFISQLLAQTLTQQRKVIEEIAEKYMNDGLAMGDFLQEVNEKLK